jgi:hypothetical protein
VVRQLLWPNRVKKVKEVTRLFRKKTRSGLKAITREEPTTHELNPVRGMMVENGMVKMRVENVLEGRKRVAWIAAPFFFCDDDW